MRMLRIIFTFFIFTMTFFISSQERYPNGQLKSEGDERNGIYTEYFENGYIRRKTDRRSPKLWTYRYEGYENGQAKVVNTIHADSISFEHREYYESGRLKEKGNYVVRFDTNEKGDTVRTSAFQDDMWTWYGPEGDSTSLLLDRGKCVGTGRVIKYYFNGQIDRNINYVEGEVNGEVLMYYESGQRKHISKKIDKNIEEVIYYYENGNMESLYYYKNGIRVGESFWYYWDGTVKTKTTYRSNTGKPAEEVEYSLNGITIKTIYKKREKAISYYYDKQGKLFKVSNIRSPYLLVITEFDDDGKKISKERLHFKRK